MTILECLLSKSPGEVSRNTDQYGNEESARQEISQ